MLETGMRKLEVEAVEEVNFLWKRKHFDERDWKQKPTRKRLILIRSWKRNKKIPKVRKRKRTRKHKTSRGAESGSIKNLTASTSLVRKCCGISLHAPTDFLRNR